MFVPPTCITITHAYSTIGVYLLWKIGIAHGDVSLSNMMAKYGPDGKIIGVLNDFDLAAIMEPGARNPTKKGWERTGTLPFMSLDLLKHFNGQIKRWYRHDLESSAWCFAYHMFEKRPDDWLIPDHVLTYKSKGSFVGNTKAYKVKPAWMDYKNFVYAWLDEWSDLDYSREKLTRDMSDDETLIKLEEEDKKVEDKAYVKDAIDAASRLKASAGLEVFKSADIWIDVTLIVI